MIVTKFLLFKEEPEKEQLCIHYVFDGEGEGITVHTHEYSHASFAVIGDFEITDGLGKSVILKQSDRIIFSAGKPHGIRPLKVGNQLLNINSVGGKDGF